MLKIKSTKKTIDTLSNFSFLLIHWKWIIPLITLIFIGIYLYLSISFGLGYKEIQIFNNKKVYSASQYAWLAWILITITTIAGWMAVTSTIFMTRFKKIFIIFEVVSLSLFFVNSIIIQTWYTAIRKFITLFLVVYQFYYWNNKNLQKPKYMNYKYSILSLVVLISLSYLFGYLISLISNPAWTDPKPYLDAVSFTFAIGGSIFIIFGYIECWFFWLIADFIGFVMFGLIAGQISTSLSEFSYFLLDLLSIFTWLKLLVYNKL